MNLRNWVFALARGVGNGSAKKDVCVRETQMKTNVPNVKLDGNACALLNHLHHHHRDNMYIIHINVHEMVFRHLLVTASLKPHGEDILRSA